MSTCSTSRISYITSNKRTRTLNIILLCVIQSLKKYFMLPAYLKQNLLIVLLSFVCCFSAFKAKAGLDSYEIYLNNKLLVKQHVNQPLSLDNLGLDASNINDRLIIYYDQCTAPNKLGKSRSILVRDSQGNTIKKWSFADAKEGRSGMVIPVKELLQLEKKSVSKLSLFYTAEGHGGQLLANFQVGSKSTTYQKPVMLDIKRNNYFAFSQLLFL